MIVRELLHGQWVIASPRPWHGLGNRIRSVLGSRALARRHGRRFAYAWPTGRYFGARLDQLWQIDDPTIPSLASRAAALRFQFHDETLSWVPASANERIWQVRTAHALQFVDGDRAWEPQLQGLRPVPEIADRVLDFRDNHLGVEPYVGVMIRAHSIAHQQTLAASPVEWFIQRMQDLRANYPDLRFFVSADTEEAVDRVSTAVPGAVAQRGKGAYNSLSALRASVVDLYLLASSVHVLGAHYSSFPELAQRLAGPDLSLETPAVEERVHRLEGLTQPSNPLRPQVRRPVTLD